MKYKIFTEKTISNTYNESLRKILIETNKFYNMQMLKKDKEIESLKKDLAKLNKRLDENKV